VFSFGLANFSQVLFPCFYSLLFFQRLVILPLPEKSLFQPFQKGFEFLFGASDGDSLPAFLVQFCSYSLTQFVRLSQSFPSCDPRAIFYQKIVNFYNSCFPNYTISLPVDGSSNSLQLFVLDPINFPAYFSCAILLLFLDAICSLVSEFPFL